MTKMHDIKEQVEYYANLPYQIIIETWDDGDGLYYVARVLEMPGCMIHGDTQQEALRDIDGAKRDWITTSLNLGHSIPKPLKIHKYSGKIILRIPPSTHEAMARQAEIEGVSLNQYMATALSRAVGQDEGRKVTASI